MVIEKKLRVLVVIGLCFLASSKPGQASEVDWSERTREARTLIRDSRLEDAAAILHEVADHAEDPNVRAAAFSNLGVVYARLGRYIDAEPRLRMAVLLYRESGGDKNPEQAIPLNTLAVLYLETHRYDKARTTLKRAAIAAQYEGPGEKLATTLINLGEVERAEWNFEEAEFCYREALGILGGLSGTRHPSIPVVLLNLGALSMDRGDSGEAIQYLEQALEIWRSESIEKHPYVANALAQLARAVAAEGRLPEAAVKLRRAMRIARTCLGQDHPQVAKIMAEYSNVLRQMERKREADEYAERAESIVQQSRRQNLLHHSIDLSEFQIRPSHGN